MSFRSFQRDRISRIDAAGGARVRRLAGAAGQFRNPGLSGIQSQQVQNVGSIAGLNGLFGSAVEGAVDRTRTQFLAGNRLAGLQGLIDDFLNFRPRGVSIADNARGPAGSTVLAQALGLTTGFQFGGAAGREDVMNLNPNDVGGINAGSTVAGGLDLGGSGDVPQRRFGIRASNLPAGLQGLGTSGFILPEAGRLLALNPESARTAAEGFFSPLLFR